MGNLVQLSEYRAKLGETKRAETLQRARDLVQNASGLLAGLGGEYSRIAWLLEDSMQLLETGGMEEGFPEFSEEAQFLL